MALPGYSKLTLNDLPTSNISAGTNYFVVNERRWYYYNGSEWIKHSETPVQITDQQIEAIPLVNQFSLNLNALTNEVNRHDVSINMLNGNKQNNLVSGTNIKTINNNSLLGEGNININGDGTLIDLSVKQDILISGTNIKTVNGNSLLGTGDLIISGGSNNSVIDNTELLLKFNDVNNSTNFIDESKNDSFIILGGNPIISTTESKFGGSSLYLNGSSYLNVSPIIFKKDWTLECWIKTNSTGLSTIMSQDTGGFPVGRAWTFLINESGVPIGYYNYTVGGTANLLNSSVVVNDNQWHHIAVGRNKTTAYLYVDGLLKSTYSNWLSHNISEFTPIYIGTHNTFGRFLTGYIDNLRISSKAIYTPDLYPYNFSLPDENFNVTALTNNSMSR